MGEQDPAIEFMKTRIAGAKKMALDSKKAEGVCAQHGVLVETQCVDLDVDAFLIDSMTEVKAGVQTLVKNGNSKQIKAGALTIRGYSLGEVAMLAARLLAYLTIFLLLLERMHLLDSLKAIVKAWVNG